MIVIDCGCMDYGLETSIQRLIDRFRPDVLIGIDPHPYCRPTCDYWGNTLVIRIRAAAWTARGAVRIIVDDHRTRVVPGSESDGGLTVQAIDLATVVRMASEPVVLKLDVEGAEVALLNHLVDQHLDLDIDRVLVEWHTDERVELRCPVEEW